MQRDLIITITRNDDGLGYACSDNRTKVVAVATSAHEALVDWVAQAVKAGAFESDDTPLLRPLRLKWPTDFRVVTQPFGANPKLYEKWNLPGHEGLDIRAPSGSGVYAAAAGVISLVGWIRRGHPYGYHIRIKHSFADGEYETIYAHLKEGSAQVKQGGSVTIGQLIAQSDATGNVIPPDARGSHLHFGLKKRGVSNGGYRELIDPTPYFIDGPKA